MSDLKEECARLTSLASRGENPKARKELESALASKWEGVQITGARALVRWGDDRSLELVKALVGRLSNESRRTSTLWTLSRVLGPHLHSADAAWVVELYLHRSNRHVRVALKSLFISLPKEDIRAAVERLVAGAGVDPRQASELLREIGFGVYESGL
ncbi:hypothetical protein PAGU2638_28560 [Lysobacter sp. PAGU 2638]